jgi:hypothetical protein
VIAGHGQGQRDPEATETRATYRKWLLGIVIFCTTLLLISGVAAIMIDWNSYLTGFSTVSVQTTAEPSRTN